MYEISLKEIVKITGAEIVGENLADKKVCDITTDSRKIVAKILQRTHSKKARRLF